MIKKYLFISILFISNLIIGQVTVTPNPFEINQSITITIDENSVATNCNGFSNPSKVYAHLGVGDDTNEYNISVVGNWGQDDGVGEMTNNGNGTWSITFTTNTYFNLTAEQEKYVTKMGMVFRNEDGTQEFKANGCENFVYNVKSFQVSLNSPALNSTNIISAGGNLNISATNTNGNANYVLFANDVIIDTQNNITSYTYNHTNITGNKNYVLEVTKGSSIIAKKFSVLVDPGTIYDVMPTSYQEGITYLNDTEAVLVLYAPGKDIVYVAGSFNSWNPDISYAMKRDPTRSSKFWIKLTGLTPGQIETYQYWVIDKTPLAGSATIVKVADPYSTTILAQRDSSIPSSTYPNLPSYPSGQQREVTVMQTAQTPYNWQITNFNKPKKEDLVVYEALIRDFDMDRNYQDLIDKIDYFKNLNINAIELMPVMEAEYRPSWGYDTSFHMALNNSYGSPQKLKEFIDLCHQNGIAVILDIALNHAFGPNPMVRMWNNSTDSYGLAGPTIENPYFNTVAKHTYSVGNDFNHSNSFTKNYVKRVLKHWIEDFKIDGIRWDLTKGFTQSCSDSNYSCTDSYQADRVAILKDYADYSWSLDANHYVIFEHLGSDAEEQEWANYKYNEGKGIMLWSEMWNSYKNLAQGQTSSIDISRIGNVAHGFTGKRALGYPESHDKDRLMYEMFQFGVSGVSGNLNVDLARMSAIGAVFLTVPGPKMVWHFADLGMDDSIWTCTDGSVNSDYDGISGDCKLATKPQPQWVENWLGDPNRSQVYSDWARMIDLKINEAVFEGDYSITTNTRTPKIYVYNNALSSSELKNVVILANFTTTTQNVTPDFPNIGDWYDLMDASGSTYINVASTTAPISIPAGGFKIFGNKASTLKVDNVITDGLFNLFPNPTSQSFQVNKAVDGVNIYDTMGKLIYSLKGRYEENHVFDVSTLSQGLYFVKFDYLSTSVTKRLIIN